MADLTFKALADARLSGVTVPLLPLLSLDLHHNCGISFGLFQAETGTGLIVLLLVQCAGTAIMTWWMLGARGALERWVYR